MSRPSLSLTGYPSYVAPTPEQRQRAEIEDLRNRLASLDGQSFVLGTVSAVERRGGKTFATIVCGVQMIQRELSGWASEARVGHCVRVAGPTLTPVAFAEHPPGSGLIVTVVRATDGVIEYESQLQSRTVSSGVEAEPGDRVLIDPSGSVAIRNLGPKRTSGSALGWSGDTGVDWEAIGGLVEAKRALREAVEEPITKAAIYKRYGKRACRGILLAGPPGTGKTMLGKAVATSVKRLHGKVAEGGSGFLYSKGPELIGTIVGSSEAAVRSLFADAREHHREYGYPAVIFLDEADAVIGHRGTGQRAMGDGMGKVSDSVTMQFLAEMDGLDDSGAIVLLATNRPSAIDPAFLRDGRIDLKIEVSRPSREDCEAIFARLLRGKPVARREGVEDDARELARLASADLFSDRHVLRMAVDPATKSRRRVTLSSVVSGAMVSGIVERATQRAIRREIAAPKVYGNHPEPQPGDGIALEDLQESVREVLAEEMFLSVGTAAEPSRIVGIA
jgi:SpoVK/Ycf46/Vps4 family AAA+-type ATPase